MESYPQEARARSYCAPGTHSQSTFAQTTNPQAPNPQANFPQGHFPQANVRQANNLQANFSGFPPAAYSQGINPQANFLQADFPLGVDSQAANLQGPILTPGYPTVGNFVSGPSADSLAAGPISGGFPAPPAFTPGFGTCNGPLAYQQPQFQQQPLGYQQPQVQEQPQEPLTFEQQIEAKFLRVPDPQPDPNPKPGPGRKKKNQRFWPPPNAGDYVRDKFEQLQNADEDVTKAEERLASNKDPQKTKHFQDIVERNMRKRQILWTQCERLRHGKVAIELPLTEAETQFMHHHGKWKARMAKLQEKMAELLRKYPGIVQVDHPIDTKQLSKKEKQSLNSTENWCKHTLLELRDYIFCLEDAQDRAYGKIQSKRHLFVRVQRMHELDFYDQWSHFQWPGESPLHVALRQEFSNPDSSTWSKEGPTSDGDLYSQALAYPQVQPEFNHGLGQPAVFDAQQNQDQMWDGQVADLGADAEMQQYPYGLADRLEAEIYEGIRNWDKQQQELPDANPELNTQFIDPALLQLQQQDQQPGQVEKALGPLAPPEGQEMIEDLDGQQINDDADWDMEEEEEGIEFEDVL